MKTIVERSRRKTLTLTVSPEGDAVVRAPYTASDEAIRSFLARHKRWLEKCLAERRSFSLADGAEISLLGTKYAVAEGNTRLADGTVYLPAEGREEALASLMRLMARRVMSDVTQHLAARCGFRYRRIRITSARTRWGSCNAKGNISYSFRIAFLSPDLVEYVALHELCHTRRLDHSAAFWREVSAHMPDYPERRRRLRSYDWCMRLL